MRAATYSLCSFLLTVAACGGAADEPGIGIEFRPHEATAGALTVSPDLEVTRLELQLREIKIHRDETTDEEKLKLKASGSFLVNVLDSSQNRVPVIALDPANYRKVEFKLAKPDDNRGIDGTPASLWFEGTQAGVRFRYLGESGEKITLRNADGIDLIEGDPQDFIVDLAVGTWLDGLDLSTLTATGGVVVLDKDGDNDNAYKSVRDRIRTAIKLLRHPRR